MFTRNLTKKIKFGNVSIGGSDNVVIQSMTNTKTSNINETIQQIKKLHSVGCELIRVAVFDDDDANSLKEIVKLSPITVIADIHFNFEYALKAIESGVKKIRLNPGNLDDPKKLKLICDTANKNNVAIRVGVNSGSLPQWALKQFGNNEIAIVETAKHYIKLLNSNNFYNIVISLKSTDPLIMLNSYKLACQEFDYPLHLGVTEAGTLLDSSIKSTIGLTPLLLSGIGDTIRISITDDPIYEIEVARKILNYLKIRNDLVDVISCPTCGRLNYDMIPIVEQIKEYTKKIFVPLKISILGCIVNGIGEGKEADIGVAGSKDKCIIFKKGQIYKTIAPSEVFNELKLLIDEFVENYNSNGEF